jgi:hypothetical protein
MKAISFILLSFLISSCSFSDSDVTGIKEDFEEKKPEFEKLVSEILKSKALLNTAGHFIHNEDVSKEILEKLDSVKAEIDGLEKGDCDKFDVTFRLNWDNSVAIFLCKENCSSKRTVKGFVEKGGMIDVYGLGNGWVLWIDHDFI